MVDECKEKGKEVDSDIEKFILSGKKIHPSAMDKIINDRLERKLEEEEYIKKQQGASLCPKKGRKIRLNL